MRTKAPDSSAAFRSSKSLRKENVEIAVDQTGSERSVADYSLVDAKRQRWTCATCPSSVSVVPAKWPCTKCTTSKTARQCRHLPYYFRAKVGHFHALGCPEYQEPVQAVVDVVRVERERGSPMPHPSLIDFDTRERVASASPKQVDDVGGLPHRNRHRRGGEVASSSGGSSTARDIARASEFFITHPDSRHLSLTIPGMGRGVDQYRYVFKNLLKGDVQIGTRRIWWGRVGLRRRPSRRGSLLTFSLENGRHVIVDMARWGRAACSFEDFVTKAFQKAESTRETQSAGEWTELLLFCFGELDSAGTVQTSDRRKIHLLVEVGRRLSPRDKHGSDLQAFE
jgi:hypothetical protein